ncbi:MAG: serine/threonine protein phosphatase [Firmicutes bacterium]|nr:serine/threonine protein phosphatase [Bacillota bacterium]
MTYVIGDIHGEFDQLTELLAKMDPGPDDTVYVLGDVVDRGPDPVKVLKYLMSHENMVLIAGNHELMALQCMKFLLKDINEENIASVTDLDLQMLADWRINGCDTTLRDLKALDPAERRDILEYIADADTYEDIRAGGRRFVLVHAGLGGFRPERPLWDYSLDELVWFSADYGRRYFEDACLVTGHTPTQLIKGFDEPGRVYMKNGHIALDCGACFEGGRLAGICLDTGRIYYSR